MIRRILCSILLVLFTVGAHPEMKTVDVSREELQKAWLGFELFKEKAMSKDGTVSCSSCHDLNRYGVDGLPVSVGVGGQHGSINAPSVFNSSRNFVQFWDGRAKTLEAQIDGPVHNPNEMAARWPDVIEKLKQDPVYSRYFNDLYTDGVTEKNIKDSIAVFERRLISVNSKFDRYLAGDSKAMSPVEIDGYQNFKTLGCISCHQGRNIGGNLFQTMGVMGNYFKDRGTPIKEADFGRFNVTKNEADKFVFRVPSLRNVEMTGPYFHDGSVPTLEAAVAVMARYQLGITLTQRQVDSLVAYLKTLTGGKPDILKTSEEKQ